MNDYGHWTVFEEADIKKYIGFVYVITFENGKKYVGAKKIWKRIKAAPDTFKRGPKKGFEESDWKMYTSSSNELNQMLENGIVPKEYLIVGWYPTWGKTLMAEMEMQLANDVLRSNVWLNKQIGGHFNPNCFDDLTESDVTRWLEFDKGNEHVLWPTMYKIGQRTKYVRPEETEKYIKDGWQFGRSRAEKHSTIYTCSNYEIWDYLENKAVKVENQAEFARQNNITAGHLTKLLKGELDLIKDRWGLNPDISRQRFKFALPDMSLKFLSNSDVETYFASTRGSCNKFLKENKIVKLEIEDKKSHIEKLSKLNLVQIKRTTLTSVVMLNSFKDIVNPLSSEEKSETIEWLKQYISYLKNN
ncbi:Phage protein [Yersinia phage phiR1-RT]|uniref:Phage protein n=2 Tax=Tegunavirus TaxID=1921704 RepID=I7LEK1_BPPR1|nr:homing endonuclease [Yersinia phage phiR1-RT]YP_009200344.1 homing endonuclease [Yersinia phage vB_YenM_TG1]AJD81893.1 hypothetical protein YenMTG1_083 [Yersinia phage vB_YenM_TG1]CCI88652.1 Phage protein [Yersinia phage phiR1-RT]